MVEHKGQSLSNREGRKIPNFEIRHGVKKKLGKRYNNKEKVKGQRKETSNMKGKISNDKERQTD